MDKAVEFFIENNEDIKAVLDLRTYVEGKLPHEIIKLLYGAVMNDYRNWKWGTPNTLALSCWKDNEGFQWYDRRWLNREEDRGVYFGVYNFRASSLIDNDDDEAKRPFLYLFHDARVGNLTARNLASAIVEARNKLTQIRANVVWEEIKEGTYLAKQSLSNTITIDKLRDPATLSKEFLKKSQEFTEIIAPVIYHTAKLI